MQVDVQGFSEQGYVTVSGMFSADEVASYRQHYMDLRAAGEYPGDFAGVDASSSDPLKRYPRLIHMHRWDKVSLDWMIHARIGSAFRQLLGQGAAGGADDALLQASRRPRPGLASGPVSICACSPAPA